MAATLDGLVAGNGAVFEAKFMLPWSFSEEMAAEFQRGADNLDTKKCRERKRFLCQTRQQVHFGSPRCCSGSVSEKALGLTRRHLTRAAKPAFRAPEQNRYRAALSVARARCTVLWYK